MTSSRVCAATLLASLALAALPLASAQENAEDVTSDVTFYGHIFGFGRDAPMPMNTQFPYGEADLSQGEVGHHCGTPDDTPCVDDAVNEEWWYTTAGFVQIKNYQEFDYTKLHNERGLTKDTRLDTGKDVTATFYMSADAHGWPIAACTPGAPRDVPWPVPCWNWDPGYLSQWQVEATLFTGVLGDHGGAADEAPDIAGALEGQKLKVLAQGVSDPVDVQSLEPTGNPTVWKFDINLGKPQRDTIAKEESYVVRFKWWSLKPTGEKMILPGADVWNVDGGERYPAQITLPVKGAFNVEMVVPQFVYGKLVVLGIMNTPWGSYDVNQDNITFTVTDQHGAAIQPRHLARLADFSVAHGGHYKPVNVTYVWDVFAERLPPGDYTVAIAATNYQGSASASCEGGFTILPGGVQGDIRVGECGIRTISDERLDEIKQGSADDAGGSGPGARLAPVPVPAPLQLAAFPLLPALAVAMALVARRWAP